MIQNKKLKDMIEPTSHRIDKVTQFLREIRGGSLASTSAFVTPINDPFGPAITDEALECIVGSDETKRGCEKINEIRMGKGFKPLDIHLIKLVADDCHHEHEEAKISSSNARIRLLGQALKPSLKPFSVPYVIGLTGGSASGKSNIARYLQDLGAGIIDCDKLGHMAYEPGTQCYDTLLQVFGQDLKAQDGKIDRRSLGGKVFGDPNALRQLESIVWPEISRMGKEKMQNLVEVEGKKVIIWDAAVLLQAGWDREVHEVWAAFIDQPEAVKRIVERDGKTEEQAKTRLASQSSNQELISKCNTIFYTLWDYAVTRKQVDVAWLRIQQKLF